MLEIINKKQIIEEARQAINDGDPDRVLDAKTSIDTKEIIASQIWFEDATDQALKNWCYAVNTVYRHAEHQLFQIEKTY